MNDYHLTTTLSALRDPTKAAGTAWAYATDDERKAAERAILAHMEDRTDEARVNELAKLLRATLARIKRDNPNAAPKKARKVDARNPLQKEMDKIFGRRR